MSHGLFYRCPCFVSRTGNITVALPSMQDLRALRFNQKCLNLCSNNERKSYGFGTTWGWVIKDRIFIFGWTNPLNFTSHSAEADSSSRQKGSGQQPIFRVGVCLAIPNIIMVPGLEEVQQALNRAVDCVVSVSKGVGQWSKERISKVCIHSLRPSDSINL